MEEVTKESGGHRPSVSMPSLDDFPSQVSVEENSDAAFINKDSYLCPTSTAVTTSSTEEISTTSTLVDSSQVYVTAANSFAGDSQSLLDQSNFIEDSTDTLMNSQPEVLQAALDESQVSAYFKLHFLF